MRFLEIQKHYYVKLFVKLKINKLDMGKGIHITCKFQTCILFSYQLHFYDRGTDKICIDTSVASRQEILSWRSFLIFFKTRKCFFFYLLNAFVISCLVSRILNISCLVWHFRGIPFLHRYIHLGERKYIIEES